MPDSTTELQFDTGTRAGKVSAILELPAHATSLYVMAHGAGAGMRHRFMEAMAGSLAGLGVGTFRYQFPYMETGQKRPDVPAVLHATVRAAVAMATDRAPGLPLFAGGKSMGGRMTSAAAAAEPLPGVLGLIFLGFPLHQPGKPSTTRAEHLAQVTVPMLFLQGTRDSLASLDLVRSVWESLPLATLQVVEGGDHSFAVSRRSGRTSEEAMDEMARMVRDWIGTR
ncbi:MAG: alpha/beta family hydrolase [Gemmatimonadota bacterium]